jgi:hypothetical protein
MPKGPRYGVVSPVATAQAPHSRYSRQQLDKCINRVTRAACEWLLVANGVINIASNPQPFGQ